MAISGVLLWTGAHCKIGKGVRIADCILFDHVVIEDGYAVCPQRWGPLLLGRCHHAGPSCGAAPSGVCMGLGLHECVRRGSGLLQLASRCHFNH